MDNNLLFEKVTIKEMAQLNILVDIQDASGMLLNKDKLSIYFFHTPWPIQSCLAYAMGFTIRSLP